MLFRSLRFLKQHFLHWIEVLALYEQVPGGVLTITGLEAMLAVSWIII